MSDPNFEPAGQLAAERSGEAGLAAMDGYPDPNLAYEYPQLEGQGGVYATKPTDDELWRQRVEAARQREGDEAVAQMLRDQAPRWWQFSSRPRYSKQLRDYQRERVLGRISNQRVRELVEAAYNLASRNAERRLRWIPSGDDYLRRKVGASDDARVYRQWVHAQLAKSDLARLLPGGREALPDIYESMNEPWRSLERLFEPRSYNQLVAHVVRHLDWYLDPTQPVKPPIWQISLGIAIVVLGALFGTLLHFGIRIGGGYLWGYVAKLLAVGFASLSARFFGAHKVNGRQIHNFYRFRGLINAAELYYYLAGSYAEPEERVYAGQELAEL